MRASLAFAGALLAALPLLALEPTAKELSAQRAWEDKAFRGKLADLPFSFKYDGKAAPAADWVRTETSEGLEFKSPDGLLAAKVEIRSYADYPLTTWLLRFENRGGANSKVISEVKTFDLRLPVASKAKLHKVHHMRGGMQSLEDYEQYETIISQDWWRERNLALDSKGGRACQYNWPYFNVESPDAKAGVIAVIGWQGGWSAFFDAAGDERVKLTAGQRVGKFYLKPGERVRAPRSYLLRYERADHLEAQNIWRSWFLKHNEPRLNGEIIASQTMLSGSRAPNGRLAAFGEDGYSAANMIRNFDLYEQNGLTPDYFWIDAGWYNWRPQWDEDDKKPHWRWTGDYTPDPQGFPKGPREVFDHAKAGGVKDGILWYEIERVVRSCTKIVSDENWLYPTHNFRGFCVNMGSKSGWDWVFNTVNDTMKREGSKYFRIDFNFDPGHLWSENDRLREGANRQGITEMKHVEGVYRLYEAILKAEPGRRIDNCSQGGCRNDVESLSYAAPLWKTDTTGPVNEQQMQFLGFAQWVPLFGAGGIAKCDSWEVRSRMQPYLNLSAGKPDFKVLKREVGIWKTYLAPYYTGDFYPLTRGDMKDDLWCAWEFVDPAKGAGFVQTFRRERNANPSLMVSLRGLDPAKLYTVEDVDTHECFTIAGDGSFEVKCPPRTAKIFAFRLAGEKPVALIPETMREFLKRPRWERTGLLLDEDFRAAAIKAGSRPVPLNLTVPVKADTLELYRLPQRLKVATLTVKNGEVEIDNLRVATKYEWRAMKGASEVAKGSFVTEDNVPRLCRIEGAWGSGGGNVRDLGGGRTADGRRIRQGLIYRTAAFNQTAHTPKDKRGEWKAGRNLVSEASAKEAVATFRFKTDLDFRTDEETFGMTASPLGAAVNWVHVVSSNYEDMKNPKPRAAFAHDFRLCLDSKNLPLIFHCVGGADRTGTFAWLLEGILGVAEDDLYRDWELTVFNYPPLKFNHWNFIGALTRMLNEQYPKLSAQEQCVAYAKDCGITTAEIEAFRKLMLEE